VRDLFHRHRNFVLVIGHRASLGPHTLALLEGLLGILRGAGFADQTAYHAISAIANYATGFAVLEIVPGLRGAGDAGNPEYRELISANVGSLPLHLYPNLAAVAPVMVGKEDDDFAYGVRAIVTGIRSQRPDTASGSARARAVE
jgi:TetR/AcrR family tetracycline transcriptional repressor